MLNVTHWFVGKSNGQPVDIFFTDADDPEEEFHAHNYPIYANRVSAVTFDMDRIHPLDSSTIRLNSKDVVVKQIVEDQDGLRHWTRVPHDVKVLFGWTGKIEKDEDRRL